MPDGLSCLAERALADHLAVMGAFHTRPEHGVSGGGTLVLLGPCEPGFWTHFTSEPEFTDGLHDALDRWSARTIGAIAKEMGGDAYFPFGLPNRPFIAWALASGRAWTSPVGLLVHDEAGLLVSYRGAVLLSEILDLREPNVSPCESCTDRPCLAACPAHALNEYGYKLADCHAFLDTLDGTDCMNAGCLVRRACPVSRAYGRDPAQSAYHMRHFH